MEEKYIIDTNENRRFLADMTRSLLRFGTRFPAPDGASYYLGDDGTPWVERPRETWITCRMAHVYSIGAMLGASGAPTPDECRTLAAAAVRGLCGALHDDTNGGWFAAIGADGQIAAVKQCYAHAFVILAASSAMLAGIDGARELLEDALAVFEKRFWDDESKLTFDTWNGDFSELDTYRGLNANMHTVEAFLAAADALQGEYEFLRERAGLIIGHVAAWAADNDFRIPEHFSSDWKPDLECNRDRPDDPFKPYGATPGHGIEWARLICQWSRSANIAAEEKARYLDIAEKLYCRAKSDAWNVDGAEGLVYTTDWDGSPVVHDRMHWTLAEAINTSAVLYRLTGKSCYADDYAMYLRYLDCVVLDHETGSWFHQLDRCNMLKNTVWPGKSDIYHALQATLIPYYRYDVSIASAVKRGLILD